MIIQEKLIDNSQGDIISVCKLKSSVLERKEDDENQIKLQQVEM